jgi:hypothetical protein
MDQQPQITRMERMEEETSKRTANRTNPTNLGRAVCRFEEGQSSFSSISLICVIRPIRGWFSTPIRAIREIRGWLLRT